MQSGRGKLKKWVLQFETKDPSINPLMGWESSTDTLSELRLEFSSKESAIDYAKRNKIIFEVVEPKQRKILKQIAQNFMISVINMRMIA